MFTQDNIAILYVLMKNQNKLKHRLGGRIFEPRHVIVLWSLRNKEIPGDHFCRPRYSSHHVLKLIREYRKANNANRIDMTLLCEFVLLCWKPPL